MKKLMILGAIVAALGFGACSGGGDSNREGFDSLFNQKQVDSLTVVLGDAIGLQANSEYMAHVAGNKGLSKNDVLRGVKFMMTADTSISFSYGMNVGMVLNREIKRMRAAGIDVDAAKVYAHFARYFMLDSISDDMVRIGNEEYSRLNREFQDACSLYEIAKRNNTEESQANLAKGRALIDSLSAADPDVKVLASGVAYKVLEPGQGVKLKDHDRARMIYKAKTTAGRVIENVAGPEPRVVYLGTRPVGMREALGKIATGSKAVIYVPGPLAYGVEDTRTRMGLGYNELIIYEIEAYEPVDTPKIK